MKKNNLLIIIIILLFLFFMFLFSLYFQQDIGDIYWNYGFSHAIRIGEIPYKDFNIISTPLFSFLMSIGLFIYDDFLTISIETVIINIIILYILYKLFKKNLLYIIPIYIVFFLLKTFIPTYNLLLILLILLLLLLEKEEKKDITIGVILGLLLLTKHTIGLVIALISILSVKNIKRSEKRVLGLIIPCIIFLIYLLITNSISQFIDLCILGLFNFAGSNTYIVKTYLIIILTIIIINIILLIKYRKKNSRELVYSLGCLSIVLPIFDLYHTFLYIFISIICILLFLFENKLLIVKNKYKKHLNSFFVILNIIILIVCYILVIDINKERLNIPHFKYTYMDKEEVQSKRDIYKKYNEYDKVLMLGRASTIMDIASDNDITYFNVLLYGNWGYNIDKKVMIKFNNIHNTYLFVEKKGPKEKGCQDYLYLYNYIEKNYTKIDSIYGYNIYYKE